LPNDKLGLIPEFKVTVGTDGVTAKIGEELEEKDIVELLAFSEETMYEILETHAASQAYWEALAARLTNRYKSFEEEWCKKWWAHNRRYAKYVLTGYGESKPTAESIKDTVISIYSEDTTDHEREKFLHIAHEIASKKSIFAYKSIEEFQQSMYKYLYINPPWYFETVTRTLHKYGEDCEIVKIVAKQLYARSFHMDTLIGLIGPKKSNQGPMDVKERQTMVSTTQFRRSN
jgi:hypothetical protein